MYPPWRASPVTATAAQLQQARRLAMDGRVDEAIAGYRHILARRPDHLGAALGAHLTLPPVYRSAQELRAARTRIEAGLAALLADRARYACLPAEACIAQLAWVNFFVAYQGLDDTAWQSQYGDFVAALLHVHLPEFVRAPDPPAGRGRRIRVGFVSEYFRRSTVGGYFSAWITHLDPGQFETFVYHLSPRQDGLTRHIAAHCAHFVDLATPAHASLRACAARIRADALDVLIYPEIGMDPHTLLLASLRLAPRQCAAWGHPVTTGLPGIDCFLSSRDMEPADGDGHYRERLVRLDGLGVAYPRPAPPPMKTRRDFGLPEGRTLYLCPHALFKLHPDFDTLLARLLADDADGVLVLFEADQAAVTQCYLQRLGGALAESGLDARQRIVVLPYQRHADYLAINRLCDVMLDPPHWSGGNTALDAIASGLPMVTFEGPFMRGRQSAAMLKRLGLPELVAASADDYLRIARALAHEPGWRSQVRAHLAGQAGTLFDQPGAIASLQAFLLDLAHG
jgi:CRISPR-associated protein Csy1